MIVLGYQFGQSAARSFALLGLCQQGNAQGEGVGGLGVGGQAALRGDELRAEGLAYG